MVGAAASANAALATICSDREAPRPPYSAGQLRPTSPLSCSRRCQSRRKATRASKSVGMSDGVGLMLSEEGADLVAQAELSGAGSELHWVPDVVLP